MLPCAEHLTFNSVQLGQVAHIRGHNRGDDHANKIAGRVDFRIGKVKHAYIRDW